MFKRMMIGLLAVSMSLTALSSCGEEAAVESSVSEPSQTESSAEESSTASSQETDDAGVTISYPENMQERGYTEPLVLETEPQRVVVMSKAPVLALYELGVEMIAIPEGGVTVWPEDLDATTEKLNTSMNSNFDIETVVALEPDLVVMGYTSQETYGKALDDAGIPVYYVDAGHTVPYESVKMQTQALVDAFGADSEEGAASMGRFDELEERLAGLQEKYAEKSVMVLQSSPPTHYIQTAEGTLASMAAMMGFQNVYENSETSMAQLDLETALSYKPDLVLCVGGSTEAAEHQKLMEEDFANNPEYWNSIAAVANGDILYFSSSFIASTGIGIIDNMNEFIDTIEAHYGESAQ